MNHEKYSLKKILSDPSLDQIIIPEIQRDYVWTKENVEGLLVSIQADFKRKDKIEDFDESLLDKMPPDIREKFLRTLSENKVFSNIGFIYAYRGEGETSSKYFLIDGQQRITTMYLLLLAISVKDKKQDIFRNTYFEQQVPKVDYKVREATHDFLIEFIDFILRGGDIKEVKEQFWYYTTYESDRTIQSIISNYPVIQTFVGKFPIDLSYVEDNIELWYFDTSKSEQGEELYIYMNSRGESVQPNENIKALLLEELTDEEKHTNGKEWEIWQNFFWLKKVERNENADEGFNEFLRWIEIIGFIQNHLSITQKEQMEFVRSIKASPKISKNYITLHNIKRYFKALERLSQGDLKYFEEKWLSGVSDLIDYVVILPTLLFVEQHPDALPVEIDRFMRFFHNIIKSEDVYKNPTIYAPQAILLIIEFLEAGLIDIADIGMIKKTGKYDNLLTPEELFKFTLYKNPPSESTREELENEFWSVEDFGITNGKIVFILESIGVALDSNSETEFDHKKFSRYSEHFRELFKNPNDNLRIALLTFGDYTIGDGYSSNLDMHRYNFGSDEEKWRIIVLNSQKNKVLIKLLSRFETDNKFTAEQYKIKLDHIIEVCKEQGTVQDWRANFINKPKNMKFCEAKRACIDEDDVVLLKSIKVTGADSFKSL